MSETNYLNRELSWLEFNQRVLDESRDPQIPLLERLKFLAITDSNLDEFFMVRVGGLQIIAARIGSKPDPSGLSAQEQLEAISRRAHQMVREQYECFNQELEPKLAEAGIKRVRPGEFNDRQLRGLEQVFEEEIFPVLSPLRVTGVDDFPLLTNQSLNVFVQLAPAAGSDKPRFAVLSLRRNSTRFITLHAERGYGYTLIEDAIRMYVERFFPGEKVVEAVPFRITRNADMSVRDDLAADLMAEMEEILDARKQSACVRLEIDAKASETSLAFLKQVLDVDNADVFSASGPLDLSAFMQLTDLPGFDNLKYEAWPPQPSPQVDIRRSIFDVLAQQDVLLFHPYESFEPVVRLVEAAADDPDVLAIKMTLYRTSRKSPLVAALRRAAERGKYVTAVVELKARFDEARNIEWARNLEQSGVQVIYGVKGLKTHAKICVVVRREPQGVQRYVHFGTGNYNEITSRLYSDISFMTSSEELGADATTFFNAVTGYSQPQQFRKIEAAPIGLREKLLEMIDLETQRCLQGQDAEIVAKVNSLVDTKLIDALYTASQAGVRIRLNVRGICCLKPGVPGLSENISVVSIVDRFLEHARIIYFLHGGDQRVYISSADWMPRNLDRRVELLTPIDDFALKSRLISVLHTYFLDTVKAKMLRADGSYVKVTPSDGLEPLRSQEFFYRETRAAVKQAEQSRRTTFEPHRAPGAEVI
ncbi:MAG TPA: polyphosphate kinase 1 [Pirellulaceae bacterium]|nr:polyphosphate kinase 1 [Pirellulaceae bacterium]